MNPPGHICATSFCDHDRNDDGIGRRGRDLVSGNVVYVSVPDTSDGDATMRARGVEPLRGHNAGQR